MEPVEESEVVKTTVTVTPINDAPQVVIPQTELTYRRNQSSVSVAKTATVTDVDNNAFNTGRLSLQFTTGRSSVNRLSIDSEAFTVDAGSRLRRNGIIIGKVLSNGVGFNPLVIEFAVNSTVRDVQNLLRSVTYSTVGSTNTDNQIRTLTVNVVDPLKATSPAVARKIKLAASP